MSTERRDHRPWPAPKRSWAIRMRWHDLLFLHWPVAADELRVHLPAGLELDTFDGRAWIGVVPFRMSGVRPRFTPALPGVSAFPEINLRTYVKAAGKPGVWFLTLDVPSRLAVCIARTTFHLSYHRADMEVGADADAIRYSSSRTSPAGPVEFAASYRPIGPVYRSQPGSLDAWLTERYCLYSSNRRGRVFRGEVDHDPWPLQPAAVELVRNTMPDAYGVHLGDEEPLAHFSARLDVVAWTLDRVS